MSVFAAEDSVISITQSLKKLFSIAGPLIGARLTNTLVTFVTMLMVARLGHAQLAASALAFSIYVFLLMVASGIIYSTGVLISEEYGAKRYPLVGHVVRRSLLLGSLLSIPVMVIMWLIGPILSFFGQQANLIPLVSDFLRALSIGVLPWMWYTTLIQYSVSVARGRLAIIASLVSLPLAIIMAYGLVLGHFGLPRLGLLGLGLAYAFTYWVLFLVLMAYAVLSQHFERFELFKPLRIMKQKHYLKLLFRVGWPIGMQFAIELAIFFVITILMGLFGEVALASQQIVIQVYAIAIMIAFGIGQAVSILIGQAYGKQNIVLIKQYANIAVTVGVLLLAMVAFVFIVYPELIIRLFFNTEDPKNLSVAMLSRVLLAIAGVSIIFDGIRQIMTGALRGLQQTQVAMWVGAIITWLIGLPLGYLLGFKFSYGPIGIALGFMAAFIVGAVALFWQFKRSSRRIRFADDRLLSSQA